jgi:xanthine dehydrogenase accessory factor
MTPALFASLQAARAAKRPAALVRALGSGAAALIEDGRTTGDLAVTDALRAAAAESLRTDRSHTVEIPGLGPVFVQAFNPPLRLVVVGAVHISQALAPMAALAGFDVTVVDPRRSFATAARFPNVALTHEWPDEAMARLGLDARTAVATLTHDPKIDDPALNAALRSPCFYVGALGSTRTHAKRVARLKEAGFDDTALARIKAPIGLDIGAQSPAEIAASILAEIVAALRGPKRAK